MSIFPRSEYEAIDTAGLLILRVAFVCSTCQYFQLMHSTPRGVVLMAYGRIMFVPLDEALALVRKHLDPSYALNYKTPLRTSI